MVVTGTARLGEAASIARASPPAICRLHGRGSRTAWTGMWPLASVPLMHSPCPQTPGEPAGHRDPRLGPKRKGALCLAILRTHLFPGASDASCFLL